MPSQTPREPSQMGPLCLPLVKYSYATVSDNKPRPIPWTHLSSRSNLFAVFENMRFQNSQGQVTDQRVFKVMQDPNIMVVFLVVLVRNRISVTNLPTMD